MKTIKTLIAITLISAAAALAQETGYIIYNNDGTVTIISNRDYNGVPVCVPPPIYVPVQPPPPRQNPNLTRGIYEEMDAVLEGIYP